MNNYYQESMENFIGFIREPLLMTKPNVVKESSGLTWLKTGYQYPLFNGCFTLHGKPANLQSLIPEIKVYFDGMPFVYWQQANTEDAELVDAVMQENGFMNGGSYSAVRLTLADMNTVTAPGAIEVRRVTSANEMERFYQIISEVFQISGIPGENLKEILLASLSLPHCYHYMGYINNEPISTLTVYQSAGVAGIYNVATLVGSRGKGALSAMSLHALQVAKSSGCQVAVGQLMSKNMAGPMADKLGFKVVCQFTPYIYGMSGDLEA